MGGSSNVSRLTVRPELVERWSQKCLWLSIRSAASAGSFSKCSENTSAFNVEDLGRAGMLVNRANISRATRRSLPMSPASS